MHYERLASSHFPPPPPLPSLWTFRVPLLRASREPLSKTLRTSSSNSPSADCPRWRCPPFPLYLLPGSWKLSPLTRSARSATVLMVHLEGCLCLLLPVGQFEAALQWCPLSMVLSLLQFARWSFPCRRVAVSKVPPQWRMCPSWPAAAPIDWPE